MKDGAKGKLFVLLWKNSALVVIAASVLAVHWKISSSRLFTYLHFAYYKALSGSHSTALPGNSIKHSVACHSQTGLWVSTLPLFPCHWYARIQITRPVLRSQGPTSISLFPTASFNDFITHLQDFFIIRRALASGMPGIGLTCPGRRWIMQRVLGVLEIQSTMIILFTQAGCRLSWLD